MVKFQFRQRCLKLLSNSILKKLRVFHLILIVIIVMLISLVVQGYLGITTIDAMHQENEKMYNTSMRFMNELDTLNNHLLFLKENFLKRLLNLSGSYALAYTFKDMDSNVQNIIAMNKETVNDSNNLRSFDAPLKDLVATNKELKKLAFAADTKDNFLACETKITQALKDLTDIRIRVQQSSYSASASSSMNSQNQKTTALLLLIVSAGIAIVVGLIINASVSWPLREIIQSARMIAAGDFTRDIHSFGCRESYEVVRELNTSLSSLRLLIGKINNEAGQITQAGGELKMAAHESGRSAEEVAKAMQELSQAASSQATQVTQTAQTVNILGELVRRVSQETVNIANTSRQVADSAQNGQKVTSDVASEINEIYRSTQKIGDVIRELNNATQEIGEITTEIREIADQTTLLSLNASIEAARAGEQGRGFGVVANETGKLADRCKIAAQNIADRTVQMIEHTKLAVQLMEQGISRVEEGRNLASQATVTFGGIFHELKEVLTKINEVAQSAQDMSSHNEAVISAVSNIAALSQESMASTQEVSATAEEQSAAAQQVTSQAENLLEISNEMKQTAVVFKI